MSGDRTSIDPANFSAAGETVAETLERAAIPVAPPPPMPGPSPADTAASQLATQMGARITTAATDLAPRGPKIRGASQAAVAELQAQDQLGAQQIKGVSSQQSAIDQIVGTMVSGGGESAKPAPDTLLGRLAAASPGSGANTVLGNLTSVAHAPATDAIDLITGNMTAPAQSTVGSTLTEMGKGYLGNKTDWIFAVGSGKAGQVLDGVAELTRSGAPENRWVGKAVEEIRLFGSETTGSRLGGLPGLAFAGAVFAKDTGQDHMPPVHAFVRESAALVAGTVAGAPLEISVIGAPLGIVAGGLASNVTAGAVDTLYYMGKGVADAGGPGAVLRVARWGMPPA